MQRTVSIWSIAAAVIGIITVILLWRLTITDSYTTDEKAHVSAGLTYVTDRSMALNPEHPPLLKILSGLFVDQFVDPVRPELDVLAKDNSNPQYIYGDQLFRLNGSVHEKLIHFSRIPFVLVTILFIGLFYYEARKRFGEKLAVLALALIAMSPTVLSHGHLVTFDVGAALAYFLVLVSFATYIVAPTMKRAIIAGVCLGIALLMKFSVLVLLPGLFVGLIIWLYVRRPSNVYKMFGQLVAGSLCAGLVVYLTYFSVLRGYDPSQNRIDIQRLTATYIYQPIMQTTANLATHRLTQPIANYALGTIMTVSRSQGGNVTYFLGTVENFGHTGYFPMLFLTKETLPSLITILLALILVITTAAKQYKRLDLKEMITNNPLEFFMVLAIVLYWWLAMSSPLNIGYRHVLPTIPLIIWLAIRAIHGWFDQERMNYKGVALGLLTFWVIAEPLINYPNLLNYYNQLVGGDENGYTVAVDSNYDWGQDLIRLRDYTEANKIDSLALDYFGGDIPEHYLGNTYKVWRSSFGPPTGWFAISATVLLNAYSPHSADLPIGEIDTYSWLGDREPVARVGSIFIYYFPESSDS